MSSGDESVGRTQERLRKPSTCKKRTYGKTYGDCPQETGRRGERGAAGLRGRPAWLLFLPSSPSSKVNAKNKTKIKFKKKIAVFVSPPCKNDTGKIPVGVVTLSRGSPYTYGHREDFFSIASAEFKVTSGSVRTLFSWTLMVQSVELEQLEFGDFSGFDSLCYV